MKKNNCKQSKRNFDDEYYQQDEYYNSNLYEDEEYLREIEQDEEEFLEEERRLIEEFEAEQRQLGYEYENEINDLTDDYDQQYQKFCDYLIANPIIVAGLREKLKTEKTIHLLHGYYLFEVTEEFLNNLPNSKK